MNNQNITEFLEYYLNLPQSPEYAVMIDAPWGTRHFRRPAAFAKRMEAV